MEVSTPFLNVVRNLLAQIIFDFELDPFVIQRVDHADVHMLEPKEFAVALIKLPERLIRPLAVDPKLRRQF